MSCIFFFPPLSTTPLISSQRRPIVAQTQTKHLELRSSSCIYVHIPLLHVLHSISLPHILKVVFSFFKRRESETHTRTDTQADRQGENAGKQEKQTDQAGRKASTKVSWRKRCFLILGNYLKTQHGDRYSFALLLAASTQRKREGRELGVWG